jgi:hypothetical protein
MVIIATLFLFISPTMTSTFASNIDKDNNKEIVVQSPFTSRHNQTLVKNNDGVTILKGATLIDGTGNLPQPNATIVITGSKVMYVSNNTSKNYDLNSFAAKNVINLTGKYIIPGLFDMHALAFGLWSYHHKKSWWTY